MRNKENKKGITLIALIITVIILLILAGVSINALIGDNGIIKNAQEAKESADEAQMREELEYFMFQFNASEYSDMNGGLSAYLSRAIRNGEIDNFIATTDGEFAVIEKDGKYYQILKTDGQENVYEVVNAEIDGTIKEILEQEASLHNEGDARSSIILTQKTLNETEGFSFIDGESYIILDENLTGKDFDFQIPAGDPVTIKIPYNMTIDNSQETTKSAIDLEAGATLNLYVYGNVTVNSGYGEQTEPAIKDNYTYEEGIVGGNGAKAGIHVPKNATLNLYGSGTIYCYGGDAGDGGNGGDNNLDIGGAGGGRCSEQESEVMAAEAVHQSIHVLECQEKKEKIVEMLIFMMI